VGVFLSLIWPNLKGAIALLSIVITILDVTVFDRVQKGILKAGAKLQEQFDCTVLELPWDQFTVGDKVLPEIVHQASSKYLDGKDDPQLLNWYPPVVGRAPLHLARIICQRTNLWYDASVRRQYGAWALGITIGLAVVLILVGMMRGLTIDSFVLTVLAPAAPIIIWGVRDYLRQRDATEGLDRVRSAIENLWERAKVGGCSDVDCTGESRQLQNLIYERRSMSPLIFSWVYNIKRPSLENQMNKSAEDFVGEIKL
jgi:hypothetical protein